MTLNNTNKKLIKVAVTMKDESQSHNPFLGHLNFEEPMSNFIKILCNHFKVDHPDDYGLQFVDSPSHYISDSNRERLKDGELLVLVSSVERLSDKIVKTLLNGNVHEKADALQSLAKCSNDPLIAKEFIRLQGMKYLVSGVEEDRFEPKLLGNALMSLVEIMDHGFISWDSLQKLFIKKDNQDLDTDNWTSMCLVGYQKVADTMENWQPH